MDGRMDGRMDECEPPAVLCGLVEFSNNFGASEAFNEAFIFSAAVPVSPSEPRVGCEGPVIPSHCSIFARTYTACQKKKRKRWWWK